jgi:hypothetical protein
MSSLVPQGVVLNGVGYTILDRLDLEDGLPYSWRPWIEKIELLVIQQAELTGSSRPAKATRPDLLSWRMDDWSGGEGQKILDPSDDANFGKYYYSNGAVDVRTKGQATLGLAFSSSSGTTLGNKKQGPFLIHRGGAFSRVEAYVDDRVFSNTLAAQDSWTNQGQAAKTAGNLIAGPARVHGGYVFAAYKDGTGGANSSDVRRIDGGFGTAAAVASGAAATAGSNGENVIIADNRLIFMKDSGGQLVVNRNTSTPVSSLPLTMATVYTVENVGAECGIDNISNRVFILSQFAGDEEEPRVHYYDGTTGIERARLPVGFRMDATPYDAAIFLGDIFFVGGYRQGATGFPTQGMLVYVSGGRVGTVGLIRDGIEANRIICLHGGFRNQLMIGTSASKAFVYDIQNGGLSQLFDGIDANLDIVSMDYYRGVYYAATRAAASGTSDAVKVWRTQATGNNKYPASSTIIGSQYDFLYPESDKIIESVEVETSPLPAGTSVTLSLLLDDNTTVTTDKLGNALTHSGTNATRTKFFISGLSGAGAQVSRNCRVLRVDVTLNAPANRDLTPTLYAVTVKALPRAFTFFYEMILNLKDDAPGEWSFPNPQNGILKANNLRTLRDANPQKPFGMQLHFTSGTHMFPESESPTYEVVLDDLEIHLMKRGNGYARVLLRRVDV